MAARDFFLAFAISSLLLLHFDVSCFASSGTDDELEEDLRFLAEEEIDADSVNGGTAEFGDDVGEGFDLDDDGGFDSAGYGSYEDDTPAFDEKDVVVLTDGNFSAFVSGKRNVMVEFYAPWCGHCQSLAPEYAAAATELKGDDVVLAKVDATEENELAHKFEIQGFPTVLFFMDGVHKPYSGGRNREAIVTWIKKKIGPAVHNITTIEESEKILTSENMVVLGFLDSLVGADSRELAAASRLDDGIHFYQTIVPDVASLFHIDPQVKRPSLVMLKKDIDKLAYFDGEFTRAAISKFVASSKLPLVTALSRDSAPEIFDNPIKKQIILFAVSNDSEKLIPTLQEAAKSFKGKIIFVYVEIDNEDFGQSVSSYFGVTGNDPKVLAYTGNEDAKKYILDGEVTVSNIKTFAEAFLGEKLKPFYKSDPIPETNDGVVRIVVGNNFDEIVLDESKDVLLEIYAPWCGHCQALEPVYNKLAKHLRGIESLVIAKMDGTTNEHPRAKADGFPTLLFFPAGSKSFDPITVDTDRTVTAFYKFIKHNAAIPFKLQKPNRTAKLDGADNDSSASEEETSTINTSNLKDEL